MLKYLILGSLILLVMFCMNTMKNTEGFQTFNQCRGLGYSKEFCIQTPTSVFGPAGCMCPDGSMGFVYPGLRGRCLCTRSHTTYLH